MPVWLCAFFNPVQSVQLEQLGLSVFSNVLAVVQKLRYVLCTILTVCTIATFLTIVAAGTVVAVAAIIAIGAILTVRRVFTARAVPTSRAVYVLVSN